MMGKGRRGERKRFWSAKKISLDNSRATRRLADLTVAGGASSILALPRCLSGAIIAGVYALIVGEVLYRGEDIQYKLVNT